MVKCKGLGIRLVGLKCQLSCTMLGVSLFISCKNKIQCVCVEKNVNVIYSTNIYIYMFRKI